MSGNSDSSDVVGAELEQGDEDDPGLIAEKEQGLSSTTVYEIISLEGLEEMRRPLKSLWWSGVIAGIAISFSLYAMAALRMALPGDGKHMLENFGYPVGFLIVVLSRLQLFTENTITPILPALKFMRKDMFIKVCRLWIIVLVANLVGTFVAAVTPLMLPVFSPEHTSAMVEISHHFAHRPLPEVFFSAIPAGFLVAVMVWMLPRAKGQAFWVIILITFTIALLDTSHVVVGSTEMWVVMLHDGLSITQTLLPVITAGVGNVVGGTVLFAGLAYGQVVDEMKPEVEK